jgi:hypothetical protein
MPTTEVSGVTLDRQKASALQGLKMVMDNLQYSRKLVARRVLHLVQSFYTEPRVYHVTQWRTPGEPSEQVAINQRDAAGRVANDVTVGSLDVTVGNAPSRDSFQEQQFGEALELRKAGLTIPDYHIVLHSNLHNKEQIAEEVKQLQGLGEPGPMEQQMQKVQLRNQIAEVEKLEAEVQEIKSKAGYNQVRSKTELAEAQREQFEAITQHERELARMRADLQKHFSGLQNDQALAQIHTSSNQTIKRYTTLMDVLDNEQERVAQQQREEEAAGREEQARDAQQSTGS